MFEVNNNDIRTTFTMEFFCENNGFKSLTTFARKLCRRGRSCVFIVNFEHILHLSLLFLLLTLNS